jgi:hypothetical protein
MLNEWSELNIYNGGTLHDDFCGPNKDIYIENWGNNPIYVRIRLDEYMELGVGAGVKSGDGLNNAKPLVQGTDLNNPKTWIPHSPKMKPEIGSKNFHEYWEWVMGGQKYYFPVSESKRNGSYVDQLSPEDLGPGDVNLDGAAAVQTPLAAVLTMGQWVAAGKPVGNYWVMDTDGWAYWASAVEPGKATGLLLSEVNLISIPSQAYYYGINVIAQMATKDGKDDEGNDDNYTKFEYAGGWTPDGEELMRLVTSAAPGWDGQAEEEKPALLREEAIGEDGALYMNLGDNAYLNMSGSGDRQELICAGEDMLPGTEDDMGGVISANGVRYLAGDGGLYFSKGQDRLLGTADDVLVGLCLLEITDKVVLPEYTSAPATPSPSPSAAFTRSPMPSDLPDPASTEQRDDVSGNFDPSETPFPGNLDYSTTSSALKASPAPTATQTAPPSMSTAPPFSGASSPDPAPKSDIGDLIRRGDIDAVAYGYNTYKGVYVYIYNKLNYSIYINVPYGTWFQNSDPSHQNMLCAKNYNWYMAPGESKYYFFDAACMNAHKVTPTSNDTFTIVNYDENDPLAKLVKLCNQKSLPHQVMQAAVWVLTDNYSDASISAFLDTSEHTPMIRSLIAEISTS